MSPVSRPSCPHDIGPGISVCLRCRQEERQLALARQRRMLMRVGLVLAGVAVVGVTGNAVVNAVRASKNARAKEPLQLLASITTTSTVKQQGAPATAVAPVVVPVANTGSPIKTSPVETPAPSFSLKVPEGRTELRDSMYVERSADSVVVHFDTELGRTRRRDKFETTVRVTLPVLYGALADSMLAALPEGAITGGLDLVSEVSARGVRLMVPTGGTLELWPVTRPGRDGPLVVGYRARVRP